MDQIKASDSINSGKQISHKNLCGGCKLNFVSVKSFDEHRAGSYTKRERHCLSVDQMIQKGFTQWPDHSWILLSPPKKVKAEKAPMLVVLEQSVLSLIHI